MKISRHDAEIAKKIFRMWLVDEGMSVDELDELLFMDVKPLYFEYVDRNTEPYKPPRKSPEEPKGDWGDFHDAMSGA